MEKHQWEREDFTTKDIETRSGCGLCGGGGSGGDGGGGGGVSGGCGSSGGRGVGVSGGRGGSNDGGRLGRGGGSDGAGVAGPHGKQVQLGSDGGAPLRRGEGVFRVGEVRWVGGLQMVWMGVMGLKGEHDGWLGRRGEEKEGGVESLKHVSNQ